MKTSLNHKDLKKNCKFMFSESTWTNKVYWLLQFERITILYLCSKINIIKQDFNSHPVYWLSMGIHQANDYPKPALSVHDTLLANQHFYFYEQSVHCEIQWYCYKNKSSIISIHIYMMSSFWQKSLVKHNQMVIVMIKDLGFTCVCTRPPVKFNR